MKFLMLFAVCASVNAWANLHLAPPDFYTQLGKAVFVDFTKAQYDVTYDIPSETTKVKTTIWFTATKAGKPVFDLVPDVDGLTLNGARAGSRQIKFPDGASELRIVDREVAPGDHVLQITSSFDANVSYDYTNRTVSSAFWIRDLRDRMFLEQYVPSNFEFDQYQMVLNVTFVGNRRAQEIFTNGEVSKKSANSWSITFPKHFTVSCPYFHTAPKGKFVRADFSYPSISGRQIPITIYSPSAGQTEEFRQETRRVLEELESDYGAWGHPSFLAYGTPNGSGGMEHAGATATSFSALDHEMLHSYFAKGVMPANGNSGWIDEAIASWRDKGYTRLPAPGFGGSNLGSQSAYKRSTDDRAYRLGNAFMSYVDYRLQNVGGLKAFLKGYHQAYRKTVITTEHFKNNLEFFSGLEFDGDFQTYIWGKNSKDAPEAGENPAHPELTEEELRGLL